MAFIKQALIATLLHTAEAGKGPTKGFRWGQWSDWEDCKKVGKHGEFGSKTRNRVCLGPIPKKKIAKDRCLEDAHLTSLDNLGNSQTMECTAEELAAQQEREKNGPGGIARMNPLEETRWQNWQSWSKCSQNDNSRKRYRYCGDAFRREIQPNRVCKNNGSRGSGFKGRSSKRDTNKQIESCGRSGQDDSGSSSNYGSDFSYASSGSSFGGSSFGARFSGRVSAPECYLPPGTKTDGLARIVGGRPADEEEHPHIVMLSYKGFGGYGQFCDGSIIHNRYILTAAHCFVGWDESPSTYEVIVGAYHKNQARENQATYYLESITCHDSYRVSSRQIIYDICLLKTTEDISFNARVWPICLPDNLPAPNDGTYDKKCVVAGWGDTRYTGDGNILNEVEVPVLTYDTCVEWYEAENILIDTEQHVCAGYEKGGLDACQGDSGGPFVCKRDVQLASSTVELKVLTGIVSFGVGCAQEKNPGVYSNVNYFLPYIYEIINEHDACFPDNPCQNGGVCIDTFHGYECECPSNFVGDKCETNKDTIDACFNNDCQQGTCILDPNDSNAYTCECDEDYAGPKCEILTNLCRRISCVNGDCAVEDGVPVCTCSDGWSGSTCEEDIDECAEDPCIEGATCSNTKGGFECVCQAGFDGDGRKDGNGCDDIDECAERLHNCGPQSLCINEYGDFSCKCRDGFVGKPPVERCQRAQKSTSAKTCSSAYTHFMSSPHLFYEDDTPRFDMQCGFGADKPSMNLAEMSENPQLRHPLTSNPGGNGGDDHCVLTCKPGSIGQFPVFARLSDGVSARVECLPKKLKPMWKPTKVQLRCYGCAKLPGVLLENCEVKSKKAVVCQASCENGTPGNWSFKCNKFRGKFQWAKNLLSTITETCQP